MAAKRHWYSQRTAADAPSTMDDQAWDGNVHAAWAQGYNDAVRACLDEMRAVFQREQAR